MLDREQRELTQMTKLIRLVQEDHKRAKATAAFESFGLGLG